MWGGGAETRASAGLVQKWDGEERRINTANDWLKEDRRMQDEVYHLMEDVAYLDIMAKYQAK